MRMKILVIGEDRHFEECRQKIGAHEFTHRADHEEGESLLNDHDLVFDFLIDTQPQSFSMYVGKKITAFLSTVRITLMELAKKADGPMACTVFGFNGFPTMFNREFLEVSLLKSDDQALLEKLCHDLETSYLVVDDRVAMVTPRVVCMVINEAYYTVQEGTATREDIDLAMKLGTNYPFGPFEWCELIGLKHVYELLEALYHDTKDERYKISALMKKEYLALPAKV